MTSDKKIEVAAIVVLDIDRSSGGDSALTLARLLGRWGHEVQVSHNGPDALGSARASVPEVVMLDIGLPGMDGYEIARRLRREPPTARSLIVAMTGYGQEDDRRKSRAAGFDFHLAKPVVVLELRPLLAGR